MPYESLICPKCGSADSQEVKPGTHFCNYCDNVFKYVPSTAKGGGVAACAACGVVATGLCATCKRYFCRGHQAVEYNTRYTDWCSACLKERNAMWKEEKARREEEAALLSRRCGRIYLEESARSELTAARIPVVQLCQVCPRVVSRFGRERTIKDYNWGEVGTGWLLGDFNWVAPKFGGSCQTVFFAECRGLPSLSFPARDFAASSHRDVQSLVFGRVTGRTADRRYAVITDPGQLKASYEELGAAVQRLAGTTEQHR